MLGAAGCKWITEDKYCCHIDKVKDGSFRCLKYDIDLKNHHLGEPIRAKVCGDEAAKDIWSQVIENRF